MANEGVKASHGVVCGRLVTSLCEYARSRLNGKELELFFSRLPPEEHRMILSAGDSDWYPLSIDRHLREEIAREFDPKNPRKAVFEAGIFMAQCALADFKNSPPGSMSLKTLLSKAPVIWRRFYRPGKVRARMAGRNQVIVKLTEFPCDSLFCSLIEAWLVVVGQRLGLKDVKVSETACGRRGECCRWGVTWEE